MFKKRKSIRINNRKLMYSMLIFVLIGIATMTIAYATLSTTLRITGSAEFEDASWSFVLEELPVLDSWEVPRENYSGNVITYGKAKLVNKPTILGTSINNYKMSFSQIGDNMYLEYVLKNTGEVPAIIEDIIYSDTRITAENQDEIDLIYDNFNYYVWFYPLYEEDGELVDGEYFSDPSQFILCPGEMVGVEIYAGYDWEAPRVPYGGATISNMNVDFVLGATDQNLCY